MPSSRLAAKRWVHCLAIAEEELALAEVVLVVHIVAAKAAQVSQPLPRTLAAEKVAAPLVWASAAYCSRIEPCSSAAADVLALAREVRRGHRSTSGAPW